MRPPGRGRAESTGPPRGSRPKPRPTDGPLAGARDDDDERRGRRRGDLATRFGRHRLFLVEGRRTSCRFVNKRAPETIVQTKSPCALGRTRRAARRSRRIYFCVRNRGPPPRTSSTRGHDAAPTARGASVPGGVRVGPARPRDDVRRLGRDGRDDGAPERGLHDELAQQRRPPQIRDAHENWPRDEHPRGPSLHAQAEEQVLRPRHRHRERGPRARHRVRDRGPTEGRAAGARARLHELPAELPGVHHQGEPRERLPPRGPRGPRRLRRGQLPRVLDQGVREPRAHVDVDALPAYTRRGREHARVAGLPVLPLRVSGGERAPDADEADERALDAAVHAAPARPRHVNGPRRADRLRRAADERRRDAG
mmetsp:Transcript_1511/g.4446  ORF Transcript_1511/g.4446 Transcript_1511/m.4446 type:complete len:367 (-) Transcript_1511:293-1393(-)